jgi:hypothetical protein
MVLKDCFDFPENVEGLPQGPVYCDRCVLGEVTMKLLPATKEAGTQS